MIRSKRLLVLVIRPTPPEPRLPHKANLYSRILLVLSILLILGGIVTEILSRLTFTQGIDVIQTNEELPLLLLGNGLGFDALGIGVVAFCLWLAVQGIRQDRH